MTPTVALAAAIIIQATVVSVHDGDTITARTGARTETIRIADIDTPELPPRAKCASEARRAIAARDAMRKLIPPGTPIIVVVQKRRRDRYGRLLGLVITPAGESAGGRLVADGMARPWRGRREPWCRTATEKRRQTP